MRVLADRHHAGLYASLELLGRRLGWQLETPYGRDWWDAGYWNFGRRTYGDDRLARQYLEGTATETKDPGRVLLSDDEFAYPIIGTRLARARELGFDIIIASVDDNQWGFSRLARELGAKFVIQCGNTGQYIDWTLDPIVLNSSEMPTFGRGVTYHQELDHDAFLAGEPTGEWEDVSPVMSRPVMATPHRLTHPQSIRSFVHLMNETHAFGAWNELRRRLPGFTFERYGHAPPPSLADPTYVENAKPIDKIACLMAQSGWGFHDKPVGDGFGHVIHGWAAIGRPLIGHGSHYAGKMGGVFWQDLVTCIDLDLHPLPEAAALIREISADPERHAAMCCAIRGIFDATVDYDAEAAAIRAVLA